MIFSDLLFFFLFFTHLASCSHYYSFDNDAWLDEDPDVVREVMEMIFADDPCMQQPDDHLYRFVLRHYVLNRHGIKFDDPRTFKVLRNSIVNSPKFILSVFAGYHGVNAVMAEEVRSVADLSNALIFFHVNFPSTLMNAMNGEKLYGVDINRMMEDLVHFCIGHGVDFDEFQFGSDSRTAIFLMEMFRQLRFHISEPACLYHVRLYLDSLRDMKRADLLVKAQAGYISIDPKIQRLIRLPVTIPKYKILTEMCDGAEGADMIIDRLLGYLIDNTVFMFTPIDFRLKDVLFFIPKRMKCKLLLDCIEDDTIATTIIKWLVDVEQVPVPGWRQVLTASKGNPCQRTLKILKILRIDFIPVFIKWGLLSADYDYARDMILELAEVADLRSRAFLSPVDLPAEIVWLIFSYSTPIFHIHVLPLLSRAFSSCDIWHFMRANPHMRQEYLGRLLRQEPLPFVYSKTRFVEEFLARHILQADILIDDQARLITSLYSTRLWNIFFKAFGLESATEARICTSYDFRDKLLCFFKNYIWAIGSFMTTKTTSSDLCYFAAFKARNVAQNEQEYFAFCANLISHFDADSLDQMCFPEGCFYLTPPSSDGSTSSRDSD